MATRKLEERLAELHRLDPAAAGAAAQLRDALRAKTGILVAAAAKIVGEHALVDLAGELAPAYERLVERAVERDPGCRGKVAIARALHALDRWEEAVFAGGVRYVQREPAYGGPADTAGELRGVCGLAHAHFGRGDALDVLGELLADPEPVARVAAAQGLGDAGRAEATALLRFKALVGDDESEVLVATFGSLLALDPDGGVAFAARVLDVDAGDRAAAAALALGQSRREAAHPILVGWCEGRGAEQRARVGYLALALLRVEPAIRYLLDIVRGGDVVDARAALVALATFRDDAGLAARAVEAAMAHGDRAVIAEAQKAFRISARPPG